MKKLLVILIASVFSFSIFAQNSSTHDSPKEKKFNPMSFVSFTYSQVYEMGQNVQSTTVQREIKPFLINKYETTYSLWYSIRRRAEKIGYSFSNKGTPGSDGKTGSVPSELNSNMPVTMINWYDAIVWCNALSELMGLTPCYTYKGEILKDSSDARCDLAVCNFSADGYRLPSEAEWEYASRKTRYGLQNGNLISGQIDAEGKSDFEVDFKSLCWDAFNSDSAKPVGIAGTIFDPETVPECGSGNANGAGIFDMSGNVLEFCWDWFADLTVPASDYGPEFGDQRVCRGGSFSEYTPFLYCGDRYSYNPNESNNYLGFRICRSKTSE